MLKGTSEQRKSSSTAKTAALPIVFRYSYKGSETIFSTGKKRQPELWDFENEKPKDKTTGSETLSRVLKAFHEKLSTAIDKLEIEGEDPTATAVRERFLLLSGKIKRTNAPLLALWAEFIRQRKDHDNKAKSIRDRTAWSEQASRKSFEYFLMTNPNPDIKVNVSLTIDKLKKEHINAYEKYLASKKKELPIKKEGKKKHKQHIAPYGPNTIAKKLKHLKQFLESQGSPAAKFIEYKEVPTENVFLTRAELEAFQSYQFPSERLERVRDLFLLTCHTGLRISDRKRLQDAHIAGDMIVIRAQKTDKSIKMPITPSIRAIIEKYNHALPEISDQKFNDYLKECARLCIPNSQVELSENGKKRIVNKADILTSHDGIKTFATLKAGMGMPITSIAYLLGKSVAVILKSYIGVDHEKAFEDALRFDFSPLAVSK